MTHILPITTETLAEAARLIRAGRLVAFPTETVYGLGANALDSEAVARIFAAKGRPATDPLIVHVADIAAIEWIAFDIPKLAYMLAQHFWPGPLTLVLRRRPEIPANLSAGLATVAIRIPAHPIAQALIVAAGVPIAAPSANRFSRPSPTTAQHVFEDLNGNVDLILDGGPTTIGVESSIVDLSDTTPALLRPGGIPLEALREILPNISYTPRYVGVETATAAPGSLLKHYSPNAQLRLITGERVAALQFLHHEATQLMANGQTIAILVPDEDAEVLSQLSVVLRTLGPQHDLAAIAHALFARIREVDQLGVDRILVRGVRKTGLGLAIWDRLVRAAVGDVVEV